jgi:protoporphyrinogen oxidase
MPVQAEAENTFTINYQNKSRQVNASSNGASVATGGDPDKVMLVRKRLSRIYFLRKFFTYPIQLSLDTLTKLGLWTTISIMFSYLKAQLLPRKPEKNLEDFMINRFGQVLYKLFFKDYTEKVWGIPCNAISAEWGAQRIKGVSISKAIQHAVQSAVKSKKPNNGDISQKDTETSLIEQFLYPKFGPGQLWEEVARQVQEMGGTILMHHDVKRIYTSENNPQITAISAVDQITGETSYLEGDYFFSTMPVQELIGGMDGSIPDAVKHVASGLQYRDFITVGILLKKLSFQDKKTGEWKPLDLKDTWIYIQEKDVKVGRLQLFNNWSPYMVKDPDTAWVGMEFFCNTEDNFWKLPDEEIKKLAISELEKIGLACESNVLDATVLRMEKTYPAYFGTYDRFDVIREYVDRFENLFLVGRNGMHKYNNSDHSMLTAMVAVDNIAAGVISKENIWAINTEQEYHEEKAGASEPADAVKEDVPVPELEDATSIQYLLRSKENKIIMALYATVLLIQFAILKKEFPFVSFMPDSYNYLASAYHNAEVNMWPIGYGKFLRFFSLFTHSDTLLALTQYFVLELSMLYFSMVLFALLKPARPIKYIIIVFLLINPGLAIVSNYVSSDAIFTALSLVWFIQLISIYKAKNKRAIFIQAVLLFILISFRYTAIYYPIIAIIVLLLTKLNWRTRVIGITVTILFPLLFVWHTSNKYKEITGIRQFSPFGGWQMASNALTMYRYNTNLSGYHVPNKYKDFHALVTKHLDSLNHLKVRPDTTFGIYYLWDERAPMRAYMTKK